MHQKHIFFSQGLMELFEVLEKCLTLASFDLLASKTRERLKVSDSSKNQQKKKRRKKRKCCFPSGDLAKLDFFSSLLLSKLGGAPHTLENMVYSRRSYFEEDLSC